MSHILFVGGIHGAGKTTLSVSIAGQIGVPHFSAGELIREHNLARSRSKAVDDVSGNQDILVAAVHQRVRGAAVLDGHFCLLTTGQRVSVVPLATFTALSPVGILLVLCEIPEIQRRLRARDGHEYDANVLACLQDQEVLHAEYVSRELNCPLLRAGPDDASAARLFATGLLSPKS